MAKTGYSIRAYARNRSVSHQAIRKHMASGLLKPAQFPDGSLDSELADAILARSLTRSRGAAPPPDLEAARRRKLAAECALLKDALSDLRASLAARATFDKLIGELALEIAEAIGGLLPTAVSCSGVPATVGFNRITDALYSILDDLSGRYQVALAETSHSDLAEPLEDLDAVALQALKTDLHAERLELVRKQQRGELVLVADLEAEAVGLVTNTRRHLLAIPSRAAPICEALPPDELRHETRRFLIEAVANLESRGATVEQLVAALDAGEARHAA